MEKSKKRGKNERDAKKPESQFYERLSAAKSAMFLSGHGSYLHVRPVRRRSVCGRCAN